MPPASTWGRLVTVAFVLCLGARAAQATPSFARKYNASCHLCHQTLYPELNSFGRQFQEAGYQMPAGAEQAYRDKDTLAPGTIAERIGLLKDLPLSARAVGYAQFPIDPGASGRNAADLRLLDQLYLVGGGSLYKNISVFFAASAAPTPLLHHAALGFHNLFSDEGYFNVRVGNLLVFDWLRPEHRTISKAGNLAATLKVGLNPTQLDTNHLGVEVFGRFLSKKLFYHLALVQGATGLDGVNDLDSYKDVFGSLQLHFHYRDRISLFGYVGRTQITSAVRQTTVRFTDAFWIGGADVELHFGPVMIYALATHGDHDNAYGTNVRTTYIGTRGEIRVSPLRDLLLLARFDGVFSSDATLQRQVAAATIGYLVLTNLKLSAEIDVDLRTVKSSTAYLLFDVAL